MGSEMCIRDSSDTAHAMLLKRMLFDQADMEPLRQRIIEKNLERGF